MQALVDRLPAGAAVVRAERARRGDGDVQPLGVLGIDQDRVEAHPTGARLPLGSGAVAAQPGQLLPCLAAVAGTEQPRVLHAGVDAVRVGERRLQVPHPLELPGVLRTVVPLVRGERLAGLGRGVVHELVALTGRHAVRSLRHAAARCLPRLARVAGALNDLSEPPARLRGVETIGIRGRSLHVIDLPPREVGTAHVPLLALAVPGQDERTLAGTHQHSYAAHVSLLVMTCPVIDGRQIYRLPATLALVGLPVSPSFGSRTRWCEIDRSGASIRLPYYGRRAAQAARLARPMAVPWAGPAGRCSRPTRPSARRSFPYQNATCGGGGPGPSAPTAPSAGPRSRTPGRTRCDSGRPAGPRRSPPGSAHAVPARLAGVPSEPP